MNWSFEQRYARNRTELLHGSTIPVKGFLVVMRYVGDTSHRGKIVRQCDTIEMAVEYAEWVKTCGSDETQANFNVWVIEKEAY